MRRAIVTGTGMYVPPRVVTNADLTKRMDTTEEWLEQHLARSPLDPEQRQHACQRHLCGVALRAWG